MIDREKLLVIVLGVLLCFGDATKALPGKIGFFLMDILEPVFAIMVPVFWIGIFVGGLALCNSDYTGLRMLGVITTITLIFMALPLLRYVKLWARKPPAKIESLPKGVAPADDE
jgi:hypothetical protein